MNVIIAFTPSITFADLSKDEMEFGEYSYKIIRSIHEQTCSCNNDGNCKLVVSREVLDQKMQKFGEGLQTIIPKLWKNLSVKMNSMSISEAEKYGEKLGAQYVESLPRSEQLLWIRMVQTCWSLSDEVVEISLSYIEDEEFRALFPKDSKKVVKNIDVESITVKNTTWEYKANDDIALYLGVAEYPKGYDMHSLPQERLDGARDMSIARVNGTIKRESRIFIEGKKAKWPGRRIYGTCKPKFNVYEINMTMYLVDNRLYSIYIVTKTGQRVPLEYEKVIQSFKLKR